MIGTKHEAPRYELAISDAKCYEMSAQQLRRVRVTTAATETLIIVVNKVTTVNKW
jgi:hypothetical protein